MSSKQVKHLIMMKVAKGALVPADRFAEAELRNRHYTIGEVVQVEILKLRSPGFNRLVHEFGVLLKESVDSLSLLSPHEIIKRLQTESGIECDEIALRMDGHNVMYRIPRSLSFDSMEEGVFRVFFHNISEYVVAAYFPEMTPEDVMALLPMMPDVAV